MSSKLRTHEISFRLAPNSLKAAAEEVTLTAAEHKAVAAAAGETPIGTFVRELISAAVRKGEGELALDRARARAKDAGLTLGAYYRLVVLETIGLTELADDLASARRWFARRP
jgi:hypothetical protein